ncbi:MAG: hypothetical protein AAGJ82_05180 [Bacteroidota bacterium]
MNISRYQPKLILFYLSVLCFLFSCGESTERELPASTLQEKKLAVTVFENLTEDSTLANVGQMAAEWIAQGLMQIEDVTVLTPSTVRQLLADQDVDAVHYLATTSAVDYVFEGSYYLDQQELLLKVRLVNSRTGEVEYHLPDFRTPVVDPLHGIQEVTERIMGYWLNRTQIEQRITNPPKYEAYQIFLEGMTYYEVDDSLFRQAMEQVLALDASYFEPHLFLAYSYYYNNYNSYRSAVQARQILQRVEDRQLNLTPYQQAVYNAARAEINNDTDAAYLAFKELFKRYPDDPFVRYNAGTFALFSNHLNDAITILGGVDFEKLDFSLNVDKRNLLFLFDALHQKGDYQRILDLSYKYLSVHRDYFYELVAHINLGNEAAAAKVFNELDAQSDEQLRRPKSYYYNILGQEYLKLDQPNPAKLCLQKSMQFAPKRPGEINYERIFALFYLQAYDKGITELQALAATMTSSDRAIEQGIVLNFLAYFYAAKGNLAQAAVYQRERTQFRQQHFFYLTDAYISMQSDDYAAAVDQLKAAYRAGVVFEDISFGHHVDFLPLHGYPAFDDFVRPKE